MNKKREEILKMFLSSYNKYNSCGTVTNPLFDRIAWELSRLSVDDCIVQAYNDDDYGPEVYINVYMINGLELSVTGSVELEEGDVWDGVVFSIFRNKELLVSDYLPISDVVDKLLGVYEIYHNPKPN